MLIFYCILLKRFLHFNWPLISERPFRGSLWQTALHPSSEIPTSFWSHIWLCLMAALGVRAGLLSDLEQLLEKRKTRVQFPIQPFASHVLFLVYKYCFLTIICRTEKWWMLYFTHRICVDAVATDGFCCSLTEWSV